MSPLIMNRIRTSKSTKIIATISDQRCDVSFIKALYDEGMNVVRMNSAHLDPEGYRRVVNNVRAVSTQVAILVDTKGAEVRSTALPSDDDLWLEAGQKVLIRADAAQLTTEECIYVNYPHFVEEVPTGAQILIDDGVLALRVDAKEADALHCTILNEGSLGARKGLNVPGVRLNLPAVSARDRIAIQQAIELNMDFIAHSFVRSKEDIEEIKEVIDEYGGVGMKIIAKIENQEGIDNIEEIIAASDGIMIARGDLGIEIDLEKLPAIQNKIIHKCIMMKKPVIVCTQMLHSMINNPRPTRAEVADVASAILAGADAVMLSGETAYGKYPAESVRTMQRIIIEAEKNREDRSNFKPRQNEDDVSDVTSYLAKYTVKAIDRLGVKAILNYAASGRTARNLSAYHGAAPIYALCQDPRLARQLSLSYGIFPIVNEEEQENRAFYIQALQQLVAEKKLQPTDMVAYIGGSLAHHVGTTSLDINLVQDVLDFYVRNKK